MHWTTTSEIEQLLAANRCRAWSLDGTDSTVVDASMLGRTSRYRAFRAFRAIRGRLPEVDRLQSKPIAAFPPVRHSEAAGQQLTSPEGSRTIPSGAKRFVLSIDGIIINSVGELLFDTVEERVIRECRRSYERSLEDFAFSVVYGAQIRSKWHPIPTSGTTASKEPGARAISLLPNGLYDFEPLDEDLRNGALLKSDDDREQVRKYVGCMATCLQSRFFVGLCKDLLVRESENFLGEDDSLFKQARHFSDCRFGKNYYRHDLVEEIPALLGKPAITTLVGFLPKSPKKGAGGKRKDKYSESALIQFVSGVVLTHFTTMYEFEKSSQRQETWRVPDFHLYPS